MDRVELKKVQKALYKLPFYVVDKLFGWVIAVEEEGILQVRKRPGYHDEPLKGKRLGQRSIRLSKAYRAIYVEVNDGAINVISVEEVSKHEY